MAISEFFTSIAVCVLGIQTILLIVLILRKNPKNNAYKLLALLLFFFLLSLLNFTLFNFLRISTHLDWIPFLQLELLYGFGPALYLYTKSLSDQSFQLKSLDCLHFLPAVLEFIYYRTSIFRQGAIGLSETIHSASNILFIWVQWGGLASVIIYLMLAINILLKYRKWVRNNYSNLEQRALTWLEKPVIIYSIFWLTWIPLRMIDIWAFEDSIRPYYFDVGFIGIAIITYWIGFQGYVHTQIHTHGFISAMQQKPLKAIDQSQLLEVARALQHKMEKEKYFLESDLTLAKLANQTGFSAKEISKALNNSLNQNFHEFVNQYRVETFKKNLQREDLAHLNLLGVALESGFGSKSTFNLVFKAKTGLTPKQYKDRVVKNKS